MNLYGVFALHYHCMSKWGECAWRKDFFVEIWTVGHKWESPYQDVITLKIMKI